MTGERLFSAVLLPVLIASVIFASPESGARFSHPERCRAMSESVSFDVPGRWSKSILCRGSASAWRLLQKKEFMTPYYDRVPEADRDPGFHVSPHNFYLDVHGTIGGRGPFPLPGIALTPFAWLCRRCGSRRGDGLAHRFAGSLGRPLLVQALFADTSFGAPAIVFYLHLAMITILWKDTG